MLFDPTGPANGEFRELLGGSWDDIGQHLRAAYRYTVPRPGYPADAFGFRGGWCPRTPSL